MLRCLHVQSTWRALCADVSGPLAGLELPARAYLGRRHVGKHRCVELCSHAREGALGCDVKSCGAP